MRKVEFNDNWQYKNLNNNSEFKTITIPHDAMFSEKRQENNPGGRNIGFFAGTDYLYQKKFMLVETEPKNVVFEFEGVYRNAEIFINGEKAAFRPYGYTNFYVDASKYLKFGEENLLEVKAYNQDQPNSRWYSGAGIYRPVIMHTADEKYIMINGIKITTKSINPAIIELDIKTNTSGDLTIEILNENNVVLTKQTRTDGHCTLELEVPNAKLWDTENPNLYQCVVKFGDDLVTETFGLRTTQWSADEGFTLNGKRIILKGACIHHDNGPLGACAFEEAEERKVRIHQEVGYNALRSAHNPCSKALLEACDRLGMLVMDEYLDVWYIHKTEYDYADYMSDWWQRDLQDMVEKDYNHPSVIMYSTGNEVSETAQDRGIDLTKQMTEYLHSLDSTRPVTCGINILFNFLSSIGLGVYSDEKAKKEAEASKSSKKKKAVGSEFYNNLAGLLGDRFMKFGATLYPCDVYTRKAFANMDVAGYNYGIDRYKKDLKKYPNRLILGSETFCSDAYRFNEFAKANKRIIGDFVWAGMDYMGEAGIGSWEYEDYAPKDGTEAGWLSAGSGRINLIGRELGEALYTKVALEKEVGPFIAVKPVYQTGKHSPSAWKMTDAMPSWSFSGCDGMKAEVEVYARAHSVDLYVNDKLVANKRFKKDCKVIFKTKYYDGTIKAVSKDANGKVIGEDILKTAANDTKITLTPEQDKAINNKLIYVLLNYTDNEEIIKVMEKGRIKVEVTGGKLLALGHACPYNLDGFLNNDTAMYYGEAMAVIRVAEDSKELIVKANDDKLTSEIKITCVGGEQ